MERKTTDSMWIREHYHIGKEKSKRAKREAKATRGGVGGKRRRKGKRLKKVLTKGGWFDIIAKLTWRAARTGGTQRAWCTLKIKQRLTEITLSNHWLNDKRKPWRYISRHTAQIISEIRKYDLRCFERSDKKSTRQNLHSQLIIGY